MKEVFIGKKCIVRTNRAGVFFGTVQEYDSETRECLIANCRRLWYWDGACSLSQLAVEGSKKQSNCKFTVTVEQIVVMEVIEIIPCTTEAIKNIEMAAEWKK